MSYDISIGQILLLSIVPVLFAITVHEVAHGWVAKLLGDPTAMLLGRLTLNPFKHIDLIGTILVPAVLILAKLGVIGWAKPVPVAWENLKHPRRDMALVAVAGPVANLLMAFFWVLMMKIGLSVSSGDDMFRALYIMAEIGVTINLVLMILNMLPILPLDGGRIVSSFLPGPWAYRFNKIEPYGLFIILGLFAFGMLTTILMTPLTILRTILFTIAGL